jgi:fructose-specific phosphotransferase system IIC component
MECRLEQAGLIERIGKDHIFDTLPTAVQAYVAYYEAEHGALPPGVVAVPAPEQPIIES